MKISSTALKAKRSCASGYRWFARRFKSPAENQSVINALVADGRVDDACWLLDQFGPIKSVLVVDAISAHDFVYAGSVQVRGEVDVDATLRTGGSLNAPLRHLAGLDMLHWHGDDFDLPPEATLLASTPMTPHQAFSAGVFTLALRFHAEVNASKIEPWLIGAGRTCIRVSAERVTCARRAARVVAWRACPEKSVATRIGPSRVAGRRSACVMPVRHKHRPHRLRHRSDWPLYRLHQPRAEQALRPAPGR